MMKNAINTSLVIIISFFLAVPIVDAGIFSSGDLTFSVDQKDYYFRTGEAAAIPLNIENTYGKQIDGMLTYAYTQKINQAGMQMSSSNSQSASFSVKDGTSTQLLNFGTSDNPSTLDIDLKFTYTEKESRIVDLDGIKIHFVSDESQKQNQQNKQSSSSEKYSDPAQSSQQQDLLSQMQKQMDEILGRNQQQSRNSQQTLQNSQMAQDSSALKQQMENQINEQQRMKEEFQRQLTQNPEFQKEHKELLNQGYTLANANLNPSSDNTGDFELNYQKPNGEQASLKGQMKNGKIQNLQKNTAEIRQQILNQLEQNKQFKKYQKQLQEKGYSQQNMEVSQVQNKTNVQFDYMNQKNETAKITAEIVDDAVRNVELQTGEKKRNYWWILPALMFLAALIYNRFIKKQECTVQIVKRKIEKPFDYRSESIRMLEDSKRLFEKKKYKDAYGTAGQALRLFLSHENQLNKEITNDEIISYLRNHKKEYKKPKECFDLCSLVEFAKYEADKKDFNKIINQAEKIILMSEKRDFRRQSMTA